MMQRFIKFLATGFFIGYLPFAPGTFGTVLSGAVYYFFFPQDIKLRLIILFASIVLAVFLSGAAEKIFNKRDDSKIVIDEIVGFFAVLVFIPQVCKFQLAAFVLFRLFDAWKLPFIRKIENLPGGIGVVSDDIAAALLTVLVVNGLIMLSNFF
jgi:phosphatidylglycerophosphatase A